MPVDNVGVLSEGCMGCWGGAWCAEDSRWVGRVRSLVPVETPKQNESLKAEEKTGWEHKIRTCVASRPSSLILSLPGTQNHSWNKEGMLRPLRRRVTKALHGH